MAVHQFCNEGVNITIGTSATDVYQTPSSTQATCHSLHIANVTTETVTASVYIYDNSKAASGTILKNAQIEAGNTLCWEKPLNLEESDKLQVSTNVSANVEVFASILEIS